MEETEIAENFVKTEYERVAAAIQKQQCGVHIESVDGVVHLWDDSSPWKFAMCIPDNMYPENWPEDWPKFDSELLQVYDFSTGEVVEYDYNDELFLQKIAEMYPRNIYFIRE